MTAMDTDVINWTDPIASLAYLHGQPRSQGQIRADVADFKVAEVLGFEPSGEGEHVFLLIQKQGENTQTIAHRIAELAGVRNRDVSYCGLKDRHAITCQWFSVVYPIKKVFDGAALNSDSVRVLTQTRHLKKLRIGSHKLNQFSIVIRNVSDLADILMRLEQIKGTGVPNYFGSQRFGHQGQNLQLAQQLFAGAAIEDRKLRGLVISAARSLLFNLLVSQRVKQQWFARPMDGDIFRLFGSRSFFCETLDETILARVTSGDLQIAASLPGDGPRLSSGAAAAFEQQVLANYGSWVEGLTTLRVKADCRPIRLEPQNMTYEAFTVADEQRIKLDFELPTGSFATAVLRELITINPQQRSQLA